MGNFIPLPPGNLFLVPRTRPLERDLIRQPLQLAVIVPMLRNRIRISIDEPLRALDHLQRLLDTRRPIAHASSSDNTVGVYNVVAGGGERHALDADGGADELDGFAGGTDGFEVAEGFADPL